MKRLRSGYTTGACAAVSAKAAATLLLTGEKLTRVDIPFPDGKRVAFDLAETGYVTGKRKIAYASLIKDAGDDPDVTNGALICAEVTDNSDLDASKSQISITGGKGVGRVTKPGLAVEVGLAAINPVPLQMITQAVREVIDAVGTNRNLQVIISVPDGEELATRTLNHRLGIIGGISILGTTGIVRPVSASAWTATIDASMSVASKTGISGIILSTGRTSERAVQQYLGLGEEAYVMMGDYLAYALEAAGKEQYGFARVHVAGMWAKVLKGAMEIPQTHVRNGALEVDDALAFLQTLGVEKECVAGLQGSNTAREILVRLLDMNRQDIIHKVCQAYQYYCQSVSGLPVTVYLVYSTGTILDTAGE